MVDLSRSCSNWDAYSSVINWINNSLNTFSLHSSLFSLFHAYHTLAVGISGPSCFQGKEEACVCERVPANLVDRLINWFWDPPFILTCIVYPCGTGTPRSTSYHKRSTSSHKVTCKPKSPQDSGESSNGRPQQLSCLESPVRKQVIKKRTCSVSSPVPPKAATHRRRHKCGFSLLAAAPRPAHSAQFLEDTLSGTAYAVQPLQPVSVGTAHPLLSQIHPSKAHAWPGSSPTSDLKCMVTLED